MTSRTEALALLEPYLHDQITAEEKAKIVAAVAALIDDPEADGTDFAHPAWWRGNDAGVVGACNQIKKVLEGGKAGAYGSPLLTEVCAAVAALVEERQNLQGEHERLEAAFRAQTTRWSDAKDRAEAAESERAGLLRRIEEAKVEGIAAGLQEGRRLERKKWNP